MTATRQKATAPRWGAAQGGRAGFSLGRFGFASWPVPTPSGFHFGISPSGFVEGTPGLADEWVDAIDSAFAFASGGGLSPPVVTTLGGQPALTFSKTGPKCLGMGSSPLEADAIGEVWLVVRSTNWAADAARGAILLSAAGYPTASEINLRVWGTAGVSGTPTARTIGYNVNSTASGGTSLVDLYGSTVLADDTTYLFRWRADGSSMRIWVNGVEETLTVMGGSNAGYWFDQVPTANRCYLGNYVNSGVYALEGDMAFFMSLSGAVLTDDGVAAWERLLMGAFGI